MHWKLASLKSLLELLKWDLAFGLSSEFCLLVIFLMTLVHARGEQWSQGCLWPPRTRFAFGIIKKTNLHTRRPRLVWEAYRSCLTIQLLGIQLVTGRLGCSLEGAGKRRIFAISNYMNQRLLKPVHQGFAEVWRRLPMDGTFNQTKPLFLSSNSS